MMFEALQANIFVLIGIGSALSLSTILGMHIQIQLLKKILRQELRESICDNRKEFQQKELVVSNFLGPIYIQVSRIEIVINGRNSDLEQYHYAVLKDGHEMIRNTILKMPHFIPSHLMQDAFLILAYCDHFLEKMLMESSINASLNPQKGISFIEIKKVYPALSVTRFKRCFENYWTDLYSVKRIQ